MSGLALVTMVGLTAGSAVMLSPTANGQVPVPPARSDLPGMPVVSPTITTQPSDGATGIKPTAPVRVSVRNGVLDTVSLTNSEGKAVTGQFALDKMSWTATEPLSYATTYTWSGTAP
jgi:hypothetical protein